MRTPLEKLENEVVETAERAVEGVEHVEREVDHGSFGRAYGLTCITCGSFAALLGVVLQDWRIFIIGFLMGVMSGWLVVDNDYRP